MCSSSLSSLSSDQLLSFHLPLEIRMVKRMLNLQKQNQSTSWYLNLLFILTTIGLFTPHHSVEAHPHQVSKAKKDVDLSDDPMYFLSRYSLVVPDNATEMVNTASIGFGVFSDNKRHAYGIRFSWLPNPPANPLASEKASYIRMDNAFGPLVDMQNI